MVTSKFPSGSDRQQVTAKFDGLCLACGEDIEGGVDQLVYDDAEDAWCHAECVE